MDEHVPLVRLHKDAFDQIGAAQAKAISPAAAEIGEALNRVADRLGDALKISRSVEHVTEQIALANTRLDMHEQSFRVGLSVVKWVIGPLMGALMSLFGWALLRGQANIDQQVAAMQQTQIAVREIALRLEALNRQVNPKEGGQ